MEAQQKIGIADIQNLKDKKDLLALMCRAREECDRMDIVRFDMKSLAYYAYSSHFAHAPQRRYNVFEIPKKNGKTRTITAPCGRLKDMQKSLNYIFQCVYTPHESAMGFVPHKSVCTNALLHVGQNYVYNIDLKDFFPSITSGRVYKRLTGKPFNIKPEVASVITDLCCNNGVLPQGAPTSPVLTNIICERLDYNLSKLAVRYHVNYSRYADDITFSGMENIFHDDGDFIKAMRKYIVRNGFEINAEKTRLCTRFSRQEVTGLTVNTKINVCQKYVKQLRTMIHNWEVKGYNDAQAIFLSYYHPKKRREAPNHYIENIISGKLNYLKMVKGSDDATYVKLQQRFETLLSRQWEGVKNVNTYQYGKEEGDCFLHYDVDALINDLNELLED